MGNFSNITGCQDQEKCLNYLQMANFELESAIQLFFEIEIQSQQFVAPTQKVSQQESQPPQRQRRQIQENFELEQSQTTQELVQKYKNYKESKIDEDPGLVTGVWKIAKALFTKNQNYGEDFQKHIQSKKVKIEIKFDLGSFQDNIKIAQDRMLPLFVYVHDVSCLKILQAMFQCKSLVSIVNRYFLSYAFIANKDTLAQLPTQNIEIPSILIYRINFIDEVCLVKQIKLFPQTNFEELAVEIKTIRSNISKISAQEKLAKRLVDSPEQIHQNQIDRFRQKQLDMEVRRQQEIEQREREELLQKQDLEYMMALQQADEKKKKINDEKLRQEQLIHEQQEEEEQRQFLKAKLLSDLPQEPKENCITIQLRFFDKVITRNFNFTDKIQFIFDFVMCQDDQLFLNPKADVDLIQNFPKLSLFDKKDMLIQEIFNDSTGEQLIILEKE
ncbi:unnamed protein product (macronuclear) [Paramecium tetraurelia]|uniref:UBX domain-containing protein n=1 Tax=Paramecium tetraurelia TaxID=5888 RepID=A0BV96_PARTE|nr:uncharacterized protein GSPATT00005709001 [Paramecium tetraurelia]CAK62463.1 unnamed protein product [Paramecium tetraurelia]|eukprot:XP_001429861.1 hypothetical protein (macronuclear) [Paramecium tetraurelia strain d4-2]